MKELEIITRIHFRQTKRYTLIIRKMVERKAFLAKSNHEYHVSQLEEGVLWPNHEKIRDYYENPCLSHLVDKL